MDFDWTDAERDLKTRVMQIFDEAARFELEALEDSDAKGIKNVMSRYLRLLADTDYLTLGVGPAHREQALKLIAAQEELAVISGSLFLATEVTARMFGGLINGFGEPDRIRNLVKGVQRGEIVGAVAASEPAESGVQAGLRTEGVRGRGDYLVQGNKEFVTNGPIADCLAVVGHVDERPAVFLIESGAVGLTLGPRLETLGYNGLAVCSLELNEVRVPQERVLGPFGDRKPLEFMRLVEDLILSVASVGLMHRATYAAKRHAGTHERAGKPVVAHQEIRFKLAEMLTLLQTSRLLTYRAGWMYATSDPEAVTLVHCAKVFSAEASERVSNLAMQILAGHGYVKGNVVERAYRDAKYAALAGTTSEIARMSIADDLLVRYR